MTTALVTGGAGFLGSHLVDRLLEREIDVRVLDNLSTGSLRNLQTAADRQALSPPAAWRKSPRLEIMIGDVRDERLVRRAVRHVDCVFHLAAVPDSAASCLNPAEVHTTTAHGTLNVLRAATAERVRRVVFASCASVYGTTGGGPLSEDLPATPTSVFGASKLSAEIYCRAYQAAGHIEAVALRYFRSYGPRESRATRDRDHIPLLIDRLRRGQRPVIDDVGSGLDLLYVHDAVEATLRAALMPQTIAQIINVGSGRTESMLDVLRILNQLMGTNIPPRVLHPRPGHVPAPCARITLAQDLLGFVPRTSLVSGLAHSVDFFGTSEDPEDVPTTEITA